jgi:hypothetical protein
MSYVEQFLNSSPSTCLPPNCGGDFSSDPTRIRMNGMALKSSADYTQYNDDYDHYNTYINDEEIINLITNRDKAKQTYNKSSTDDNKQTLDAAQTELDTALKNKRISIKGLTSLDGDDGIKFSHSYSPNHYVDNLNTVNSYGDNSFDNGRNANQDDTLYQQPFNKYTNKLYLNCPYDHSASSTLGLCSKNDDTCAGTLLQVGAVDNQTIVNNCNPAPTDKFLENAIHSKAFKNVADCKNWCNNKAECGGVQTYHRFVPPVINSGIVTKRGHTDLHCNYYSSGANGIDIVDKTGDIIEYEGYLQDSTGYDLYLKNKNPYRASTQAMEVSQISLDGTTISDLKTELGQNGPNGNSDFYNPMSITEGFQNSNSNYLVLFILFLIVCLFYMKK